MTKWNELPQRPHGQAWPGLNTRGGFLSKGIGELADGSFNAVIERGDVMRKRRGLVRGLDERFPGVVCGLFRYTSECNVEYLLVADEEGIKIRTPFEVPVFETSDAYPNDSFATTGDPDPLLWRNTTPYTQVNDTLALNTSVPGTDNQVASSRHMRWFKNASNPSYQVRAQYAFDTALVVRQRTSLVVRGAGDLSSGALLQLDLERDAAGAQLIHLWHRRADATYRELLAASVPSGAGATGFLTLRYLRDVVTSRFVPGFNLVATGGVTLDQDSPTLLTELEDNDLGLVSAIGMDRASSVLSTAHNVAAIDGGPL